MNVTEGGLEIDSLQPNDVIYIKECNGDVCLQYGIKFGTCITNTFRIPHIVVDNLITYCHFLDENTTRNKMSNQEICLLLYWRFSTNMYLICGQRNRCELPKYLIEKIRDTHLN